jgi:hypothetical protein
MMMRRFNEPGVGRERKLEEESGLAKKIFGFLRLLVLFAKNRPCDGVAQFGNLLAQYCQINPKSACQAA